MRILIACEYSGRVRDAFISHGFNAMSCDLLPTDVPGPHYQGDVRDVLYDGWDAMVCHPPCTYLSVSGMHWTVRGLRDPQLTEDALEFVKLLMNAPIKHIALENPVSVIASRVRKPDQIINPYQYGEDASKKTCLWLKNLPQLKTTEYVHPRMVCCGKVVANGDKFGCPECAGQKVARPRWGNQCDSGQNKLAPSEDRWKKRSETYRGIANAMGMQWSKHIRMESTHQDVLSLKNMPPMQKILLTEQVGLL